MSGPTYRIESKHTAKGWFGRDTFYFVLSDKFGRRWTYRASAHDYFAFNVGDFLRIETVLL